VKNELFSKEKEEKKEKINASKSKPRLLEYEMRKERGCSDDY